MPEAVFSAETLLEMLPEGTKGVLFVRIPMNNMKPEALDRIHKLLVHVFQGAHMAVTPVVVPHDWELQHLDEVGIHSLRVRMKQDAD